MEKWESTDEWKSGIVLISGKVGEYSSGKVEEYS